MLPMLETHFMLPMLKHVRKECKQQQVSERCKIRISILGGFQKAEFRHKAEKFTHERTKEGRILTETLDKEEFLFLGYLTFQQHAVACQGRICSDKFTCCHTPIQVADQIFCLTQSQYTDTGPTSPRADPITPGAWQGSHWSANFLSHWYDSTPKKIPSQAGFEPGIFHSRGGRLNH